MNTEEKDIQLIAESMGYELMESFATPVYKKPNGYTGAFCPLSNDADCFKVLEALVNYGYEIQIENEGSVEIKESADYCIRHFNPYNHEQKILADKECKTLNEAICRAYLNTIGEEG